MKKVQSASIGGRNFFLDEDAYERLQEYLQHFHTRLAESSPAMPVEQIEEVMSELESRIATLFQQEVGNTPRTVNINLARCITAQLGMPDGSPEPDSGFSGNNANTTPEENTGKPHKKIYRNTEDKAIAGICSGLAIYFNVDVVLIRLIAIIALIAGTTGFWIYIILWIVIPKAESPVQKCEMHGLPVTAENLAKFSKKK